MESSTTNPMPHLPLFRDMIVHDELEPCPYIDGNVARLPLQVPHPPTTPVDIDLRLANGQRRTGDFVYVPQCPDCHMCEPIRIDVSEYVFSKTQQRTLRKNNAVMTPYIGPVQCDEERIGLFNKHRQGRGLGKGDANVSQEEYRWAFQRSCFDTFEIAYTFQDRLVAVAICDQGATSLSAVYTYYDPELAKMSLGTYFVMKQIEYCRQTKRQYLYLGFFVAGSKHMSYKANFLPHQRRLGDEWQHFPHSQSSD